MRIKDKDNKIKIESIGGGFIFRHKNDLFLKIEDDNGLEIEINAVRLDDGEPCDFPLNEEVEMVDCELVVK